MTELLHAQAALQAARARVAEARAALEEAESVLAETTERERELRRLADADRRDRTDDEHRGD